MLKCKICRKEFDGTEECVAPCGHAFHVLCLVKSPKCPLCNSAIDVYQVKTLSDHAVSSKTEKDQGSAGKGNELGAKDQESAGKGNELGAKDQESAGKGKDQGAESLDPENIPDGDKSKEGVYDLSAYVETLEDRIERCTNRMDELADMNETLDNKAEFLKQYNIKLGNANVCLRKQLHMLNTVHGLSLASDNDFEKTIASISEKPNAVQELLRYCKSLQKQLSEIRSRETLYGTKCKRGRSGNLEEPGCSNEQNSGMEEMIAQDEFDLLNLESGVAAKEPSCDNETNDPSSEVEDGISQNEVERSAAEGSVEACSSDAIKKQLAEPKNVPLDAHSSDVRMQDELGS